MRKECRSNSKETKNSDEMKKDGEKAEEQGYLRRTMLNVQYKHIWKLKIKILRKHISMKNKNRN